MEPFIPEDPSRIETGARFQRFRIGKLACTAFSDGSIRVPRPALPSGAGSDEQKTAPEFHFVPLSCLAVEIPEPGQLVLMDSGFGFDPAQLGKPMRTDGRLMESLEAADLSAGTIDVVLISHLDPDHVGGLYDSLGAQVFPNATYYASEEAVEFWSKESIDLSSSPCPPPIKQNRLRASAQMLQCAGKELQTFRSGDEVIPGIGTLALPGHAPGQVGFIVSSEGETLFYTADAIVNTVISIETPEAHNVMDLDPHLGVETRRRLVASLSESGWKSFSPHFPFPSWGSVRKHGERYTWKPAD